MRICIATGTRAEYGLLKPLIDELKKFPRITTQVLVTGAHLSPEFGSTYKQIEQNGVKIDYKVEMLLSSDTAEGITKSMALGLMGFAEAFKKLQPDLLIILGDRYEMLALASTALIFKIPIAHIHGGEITEGAYDDAIRHSITKMSHLHFASTEEYKKRIIQLGEHPETVFNVGAIGIDNIRKMQFQTKEELERELKIKFSKWNYMVAFHPETLSDESVEWQLQKILDAIDKIEDGFFIFTKANADTSGRLINDLIEEYTSKNSNKAVLFDSLGSLKYLSTIKHCNALVGNSSSGIIEAPSLGIPTINVGNRQKGRIQAKSVLNCDYDTGQILNFLLSVQDKAFVRNLFEEENPYGNGDSANQIAVILNSVNLLLLKTKRFNNINF